MQIEEISRLLKSNQDNLSTKRIQCVYFKLKYNKTPKEIAEMVGYHWSYVKEIQSKYKKEGSKAFHLKPKGGRRYSKLEFNEEKEIIKKFEEKAKTARVIGVLDIHEALMDKAGEKMHLATTYRILKRHGWRKISPRPKHPKSSAITIETFKKTLNT